ncbi:MAG: Ni/Fe-hydrogenase, b-type cytochrome subunit [Planctomycetota bacterium]
MSDVPIRQETGSPVWERRVIWQWPIRVFHWSFAASVVVLFPTGLWINRPWFTAGGSTDAYLMGWVRWLHFVAAAVFTVAFVLRVLWFFLGNAHARSGFPCVHSVRWWRDVLSQAGAYLRFDFRKPHVGHNALAGLSYVLVPLLCGLLQILTGLALFGSSDPGGFYDSAFGWVVPLFGGLFRTHMWHNLLSWLFAVFVILHVYIVVLDDRQYRNGLISSMVSGAKFFRRPTRGKPTNGR